MALGANMALGKVILDDLQGMNRARRSATPQAGF